MTDQDGRSFETFYAAVVPSLRRLAYVRTRDWGAAEELAQDALTDAHRRWDELATFDDPAAWARRAVLNRSAGQVRRWGRESRRMDRLATRRETPVASEPDFPDEELWSAITSLPKKQMQVVLLMWFEDLPIAEVAETLGCGHETVRTHWRRARASLASRLGEAQGRPKWPVPNPTTEQGAG